MGGSGSGGWYRWSSKPTADSFLQFKINALKKEGLLDVERHRHGSWAWYRNGEKCSSISYELNTLDEWSPYVRLYYTNTNSGEKYDYKVRLSSTTPHYGGKRWWFHCPAKGCGKRVAVLYGGSIYACRRCYNVAYASQNESLPFRMLSRAQKIHQQLGGDGCVDGWIKKPKGMHWKTYNRKVEQMRRIHDASLFSMARQLGMPVEGFL